VESRLGRAFKDDGQRYHTEVARVINVDQAVKLEPTAQFFGTFLDGL
jgi:hypothetical protein